MTEHEARITLTERVLQRNAAKAKREELSREFQRADAALKSEIEAHTAAINQVEAGLDQVQIALAESFMYVTGTFAKAGEDRNWARAEAMNNIANGGGRLFANYFGTKDCDHWHGQGVDPAYGMGPRHGHVIFSIGFRETTRKRAENLLTDAERDAGIYYLVHLEAIQKAAEAAKVAA